MSTFNDPDAMRPLLDMFYRAYEIEVKTRHRWEETRLWWRFNEQQRRTLRDGLSVPQSGVDGLKRYIIERSMRNGDPKRWFGRFSTRSTLSTLRKGFASARAVVLLTTTTNQQIDWIRAGRAFARAHLGLTQLGLTCTPNSQVLQEYPEMAALQREFNELVGVRDPQKVQMALRVGRAERSYIAPRRDPSQFVIDGAPGTVPGDDRLTSASAHRPAVVTARHTGIESVKSDAPMRQRRPDLTRGEAPATVTITTDNQASDIRR